MSREELSRPQRILKISCKKKLPTRERKIKLSWFSFRIKTMLHGSTKKMIGRLIFFRSSGLAHWAIYRLLNLSTYSVILRVPLVKKMVFRTLLNNKQSVARLDMLGDWREAHGFGTWRWGTSCFDAAVLKHPIWLIRINKPAAVRDWWWGWYRGWKELSQHTVYAFAVYNFALFLATSPSTSSPSQRTQMTS